MKKRIGTLNNKRIIIGDENLVTKDEILLTKKTDSIELSVRDNDKMKVISGTKGGISYTRLRIQSRGGDTNWMDFTFLNNALLDPRDPLFVLPGDLTRANPSSIHVEDYAGYYLIGLNPITFFIYMNDSNSEVITITKGTTKKVYRIHNTLEEIETFSYEEGALTFNNSSTGNLYLGVDENNYINFLIAFATAAESGPLSDLFEEIKGDGFNVDYSNFRALLI